jgi:type IV pilus assembly protein PilA
MAEHDRACPAACGTGIAIVTAYVTEVPLGRLLKNRFALYMHRPLYNVDLRRIIRRIKMKNNNEKGFSLVELLVVVIIIAIVAAIAIPNLLASRKAANEASAANSMRTIHSAEVTNYANTGTYNTMTFLSTAGLLDPSFTGNTFQKSGYNIAQSYNAGNNTYCASASNISTSTGTSGFAINQDGVVYKYATGALAAAACASGTLTVGSGLPLGSS